MADSRGWTHFVGVWGNDWCNDASTFDRVLVNFCRGISFSICFDYVSFFNQSASKVPAVKYLRYHWLPGSRHSLYRQMKYYSCWKASYKTAKPWELETGIRILFHEPSANCCLNNLEYVSNITSPVLIPFMCGSQNIANLGIYWYHIY